jgi:YHS domain-containing protein
MYLLKKIFPFVIMIIFNMTAFSQSKLETPVYVDDQGIAIRGYDPVSYFTDRRPVKGDPEFSFSWKGARWLFSSSLHKNMFAADPQKYTPQYGGYCAYGASEKHKATTEPDAWTIVNDKLYLNYNLKVKEIWIKDTTARIKLADEYWNSLPASKE